MGIRFLFIVSRAQGVSPGSCRLAPLASGVNAYLQRRFRRKHSATKEGQLTS